MPKAVRFHELGGPEVLQIEDVPASQPEKGEVLLEIQAVGLNRAESMWYHGVYPETAQLPAGLAYEAVGVVKQVGEGGDPDLVGKRQAIIPGFSMNQYPVFAEQAIVPESVLAPIPDSFSAVQGAAVWMQYSTAYGALVHYGNVGKGDFVLISAASSSVGLAAIQTVKAQGGTSIALTRTSAKKQKLLALGADHVVATQEEDLLARVKEITAGKQVKIVFDSVGGDYVETLAKATADGGTIFIYGALSGKPTPFPLGDIFGRAIGMFAYMFTQLRGTPAWEEMKKYIYGHLADGSFKPEIDRTFPFAKVQEAYLYLESNEHVGKIVVEL